jgi:hypothetical protein
MTQAKVKKCPNTELLPATVMARLQPIGSGIQDQYFTIDQATREVTVSRAFMSKAYGGSEQPTYPSIGADFFAIHGMDDFMYINNHYQCEAPQIPGAPGLFFCSGDHDTSYIRRVFVRLRPGVWQYLGQYRMERSHIPFLTKEEWAAEPKKVRWFPYVNSVTDLTTGHL